MAAFFKTPAPPGRDAARIASRPRLVRAWRIGVDGRLVCHWKTVSADILPFKAPQAVSAPAAHRGRAA